MMENAGRSARALAITAAVACFGCAAVPAASQPAPGSQRAAAGEDVVHEVHVNLDSEGLADLIRSQYMGAGVRVQPPGKFVKSVYRLEIPAEGGDAFVCSVGSDYVGICRPPPHDDMRTYPLAHVQVIFNGHCRRARNCAPASR